MNQRSQGFTLKEVLIVAVILFPVFARGKERAKLQTCESRLRQFAPGLNLYRTDHDDKGYVWTNDGRGMSYPYNFLDGMKSYLGDGSVLYCREPNPDPRTAWDFVHYQVMAVYPPKGTGKRALHVPPAPEPGQVVAYCSNHGTGGGPVRVGTYPFVREDTSAGLARSEAVRAFYFDTKGWYETPGTSYPAYLRFPGEPWPPKFESP